MFRMINLKPKLLRIAYDVSASLYSLIVVGLINGVDETWQQLAISFMVYIALLWVFGLYGKQKYASVSAKASIISLASFMTCIAGYVMFATMIIPLEFVLICSPLLFCARLFLNVNNRFLNLSTKLVNGSGKVLVIGGAGYIGTHVIRLLLNKGHYVRVLDTLMFGEEPVQEFMSNKNFKLLQGDASNVTALANAMEGIDTVIHLAGLVGDPACAINTNLTLHSNVVTARMAKDLAIAAGVRRFIFSSSCSVYGVNDSIVNESMELNPVSLYAKTKISTENELLKLSVDDFHVTILRFSTVFGHSNRQRFDLVGNLFTAQAYNDKRITVIGADQWRPFVHVKDLARAIYAVMDAPVGKVSGEIFNVGDDRLNMTIMGLAEELVSAYRDVFNTDIEISNIEMPPGDKRNYRVSFDKISSVLNFKCETGFREGFIEMLKNFKDGAYEDYKNKVYSNLAVTKELDVAFADIENQMGRYTALEFVKPSEE